MSVENANKFVKELQGPNYSKRLTYLLRMSFGRIIAQSQKNNSSNEAVDWETKEFLKRVVEQMGFKEFKDDEDTMNKIAGWWMNMEVEAFKNMIEAVKEFKKNNGKEPGPPVFMIKNSDTILEGTPDVTSTVVLTIGFE